MKFHLLLNVAGVVMCVAKLFVRKHSIGSQGRVSRLQQDANMEYGKYPATSESRHMQMNTGCREVT
jgi:hypothetical protein